MPDASGGGDGIRTRMSQDMSLVSYLYSTPLWRKMEDSNLRDPRGLLV